MHALILSDLHLGARNCQHQLLMQRLDSWVLRPYTHIILNGDVVDHLNFERFRPADWSVIRRMQQLAREDRLVVVQGNHDRPKRAQEGCISYSLVGDILNVELKSELTLHLNGQRFLLTHGDRYDQTLNMTTVGVVAETIYRNVQRLHQPTSRWLKRQSKTLLGIERAVRDQAMTDAARRGFDGVILGHTHFASHQANDEGTIYVNSGSWTDDTCHYIELFRDMLKVLAWNGYQVEVNKKASWSVTLEPSSFSQPALVY